MRESMVWRCARPPEERALPLGRLPPRVGQLGARARVSDKGAAFLYGKF